MQGTSITDLDSVPAGQIFTGRLTSGSTASGQDLTIPYMIARGRTPGPVLWVNAAVHGDEVNGTLAAIEFTRSLDVSNLSGTVLVTPVANVIALDDRRKNGSLDQLDFDQSFPGQPNGLVTQRQANCLFQAFAGVSDVVVNLHTLGAPFDSRPYAVYKLHPDTGVTERELLSAIAQFAPNFACRMPVSAASGELPGNITGALDYQCLAAGKTAFMIELGGGGRQEPEHIDHGVRGLRALCHAMGMTPGAELGKAPSRLKLVTERRHIMASTGGFFRPAVRAAALLPKGEPAGRIHDVFGNERESITFDRDALIIAIRRDPVVHSGDRIAFIGLAWEEIDVGQ